MPANGGQLHVEIFPASIGDAILLRCISKDRAVNILIDGGVPATYEDHLAARLRELHCQGQQLDLVVVTHIDTDHIGGVLELLIANGPASAPNVIAIGDIWHNGYRHLPLKGRVPSEAEKAKVFSQVSRASVSPVHGSDISVKDAETLASLITRNGYAWNHAFQGRAAIFGEKSSLAPDITLTLLSPSHRNLERLAQTWQRELLKMGVSHEAVHCQDFERAFEMQMPTLQSEGHFQETDISATTSMDPPPESVFVEDTSFTNGSSIAFLLECFGLRTVFLGDSWPGVIADHWESLYSGKGRSQVDLIKVSHHGSRRNTSPALLELLTATRYVISTDGSRHDHPNIETLLWLADACEPGSQLIFNYPTALADRMNQPTVRSRFGHITKIGRGRHPMVIVLPEEAHYE